MLNYYFEQFQKTLFADSQSAWIYLCILFLITTFFIQSIFIGPAQNKSKRISTKNLKPIHQTYLFRSLWGWFFYFISLGLFLVFWYEFYFKTFQIQVDPRAFLAGSLFAFLLSLIFRLNAFTTSCLDQIKKMEDQQLTP